jgi:hypothetical protein
MQWQLIVTFAVFGIGGLAYVVRFLVTGKS